MLMTIIGNMDIETKPGKDSVQHRDRGRKEKRSENKKKKMAGKY
jgi:hypothetical protein